MNTKHYDAIVVGGGMTGSFAAKELSEAGLKTLVLERGPERQHPQSYMHVDKDPWDYPYRGIIGQKNQASQPVQCSEHAYTAATADSFVNDRANPYSTPEDKPFRWLRSYQLGGRSLLWERQSYRWSPLDFEANSLDGAASSWPIGYEDLANFYDHVENFIGVSGSAEGLPQLPDGIFQPPMAMNDMELFAKDAIRERWPNRDVIMGRVANLTKPMNGRGMCVYRDKCVQGCPHGGYYSALSGALPAGRATGNMDVRCDAIVDKLIYNKKTSKAEAVRFIDANTNEEFEYSASIIFVCAGALNSTWLLLNSSREHGIGLASGQLGHNLMDHHTMVVSSRIKDGPDTFPEGRRPTGCYIPRFKNLDGKDSAGYKRGFAFKISAFREGWQRGLDELSIGAEWKDSLTKWGDWRATLIGFGETLPDHTNRVELNHNKLDAWGLPTLSIHAEFKENEKRMNTDMHQTAEEMLRELGGEKIDVWGEMSTPGSAIHEMGTARMGSDPKTSVLDPWNRMWEASNVYVTDGAAMVSSANQNPSLTYMAITVRAARKAIEDFKGMQ